jgi:hypothetical protein
MTNRFSNQFAGYFFVAAAVLGLIPTGAQAQKGENGDDQDIEIVPPNSSFGGHTYAEWSEKWWLWSLSLPVDKNPTTNFAASCTNGQSGHTWFLYGGPPTVTCTVPEETAVVIPVVNTECSNLEAAPFRGDTPAARRACAKAWIDNVTDLFASVDKKSVRNLARYRVQTGDFLFTVPAKNILGVPAGKGFSSADGYYLVLEPLSEGTHTIRVKGTFRDPFDPTHPIVFPLDTTITLKVGR